MVTWDEWAKQVNESLSLIRKDFEDFKTKVAFLTQVQYTNERLTKLEDALITDVFLPKYQMLIVEELRNQDRKESEIRAKIGSSSAEWQGFWKAWHGYADAKVIVPISHGRGHERTWHLSIRPGESASCNPKETKGENSQ